MMLLHVRRDANRVLAPGRVGGLGDDCGASRSAPVVSVSCSAGPGKTSRRRMPNGRYTGGTVSAGATAGKMASPWHWPDCMVLYSSQCMMERFRLGIKTWIALHITLERGIKDCSFVFFRAGPCNVLGRAKFSEAT